jgi:hypothetical protein
VFELPHKVTVTVRMCISYPNLTQISNNHCITILVIKMALICFNVVFDGSRNSRNINLIETISKRLLAWRPGLCRHVLRIVYSKLASHLGKITENCFKWVASISKAPKRMYLVSVSVYVRMSGKHVGQWNWWITGYIKTLRINPKNKALRMINCC